MNSLIVDDSRLAATSLSRIVSSIDPEGTCEVVSSAAEALERCTSGEVEVAFLDIEMPRTNGLALAQRLKRTAPQTNVVFVTGYPEYALDAWNTQASAFLVKPVDEEGVRKALDRLRNPLVQPRDRGLFVQCFGNFEVFFDGTPVSFERAHTKELFAYLIDRRGALVSIGELVAVLWEDKPDTPSRRSQLRTYISELRRIMERLDHPDAVVRRRGGVSIKLSPDECDFFAYARGVPDAINRYRGEYMCQYSWAEATLAQLSSSADLLA